MVMVVVLVVEVVVGLKNSGEMKVEVVAVVVVQAG